MIHAIGDRKPEIAADVFVAWNAEVAGEVRLAAGVSIWFGSTVRGDMAGIEIGEGTNVQDGAVVHVDTGIACIVGADVTIGHGAIIHSCVIGRGSLVGMGAIVLNGAEIGEESLVGAGALVTQGKKFPPRSLIVGSPGRCIKTLTEDEVADIRRNAGHYRELASAAREEYREIR
jgi:carbonic anhydrase/acetyltransferase-like protein (isoleucine patch superfamily)